jgi:2,5-diketo-D-gluconate reductase A
MLTVSDKEISKIGIGSFGIGGRGHRDVELTEKLDDRTYVEALIYALDHGSNFTEIALGYGHGNSLNLFKKALDQSSLSREDIFLTHSLYTRDLANIDTISEDTKNFYRVIDTDYADSTLVTQSLILKFGETKIYEFLNRLLESGRTRYVSLSNASPNWIGTFKKEFGDSFFAHEGHLSFEIRALQDNGVLKTCENLGVTNIIWRPLGRSSTLKRNWPLLKELSAKYQKTQSQIILNWICKLGYKPMVFSTKTEHIDENLSAVNFEMSLEDYQKMTDYRPADYQPPAVDWEGPSSDDDIVTLIKDFDNHMHSKNNQK